MKATSNKRKTFVFKMSRRTMRTLSYSIFEQIRYSLEAFPPIANIRNVTLEVKLSIGKTPG